MAAADALFVGDSATDVACARAAGCRVVVYRHYSQGIVPEMVEALNRLAVPCLAKRSNGPAALPQHYFTKRYYL